MNDSRSGWFDARLSIGNLITIAVVLAGIVAGWYGFDMRLKVMEVERERLEIRLSKMENERDTTRDRLISIEVTIREQRSTLDRILKAVEGGHDQKLHFRFYSAFISH